MPLPLGAIPAVALWRRYIHESPRLELDIYTATRNDLAAELGKIITENWWANADVQADQVEARKAALRSGETTRVDISERILSLSWQYYADLMGDGSAAPMYSEPNVSAGRASITSMHAAFTMAKRITSKIARTYDASIDARLHNPHEVAAALAALRIPRIENFPDPVGIEYRFNWYQSNANGSHRLEWYRDVKGDDRIPFHFDNAADAMAAK